MSEPIIVIVDVQGHYQEFLALLQQLARAGYFKKSHRLVIDGSLIDRGPQSNRCIDLAYYLQQHGAVVVGSDHSYTLSRALEDGNEGIFDWYWIWRQQYEHDFLLSYGIPEDLSPLQTVNAVCHQLTVIGRDFLRLLPWYFEDDQHVYVHAGLKLDETWPQQRGDLIHRRAAEDGPVQLFSQVLANSAHHPVEGKMLITGHVSRPEQLPQMSPTRLMLDCGVDKGGPLAAYISSEQRCVCVLGGRLTTLSTTSV